jgi:hypothetical protein
MYINQIDKLFDDIINYFNIFLIKKKIFDIFSKDTNFVKYQNKILDTIQEFIKNINMSDIKNITANIQHIEYIIEIIKRYCAFYIYLGIAYYYTGGRELFITNIIETSKNIKDSSFSITNFYNSDNNAKIINMFIIIKDILQLQDYKTLDRIKIILEAEPIKYDNTICLLNQIGEDFFNDYFIIKDNFHNIIKTLIFRQIYLLQEKNSIIQLLTDIEKDEGEYKFIDIVISKHDKMIDFTFLQNILSPEMQRTGRAYDYYNFLVKYKDDNKLNILNNYKMIDFLFSNKIIIPITDDFLRYHKATERYDKDTNSGINDRESTKIKYIINKINKIINLNSQTYKKNPQLKSDVMNLFYKSLEYKEAILYNDNEEVKIINKLDTSEQSTDLDLLFDLNNIRNYPYINYKEMSKEGIKIRPSRMIQGVRYANIKHKFPKNRKLELRVGHMNLPLNVVGIIFNPSNKPLEYFDTSKLINIKEGYKNSFDGFIDIMENKHKSDDNLYYWLFDLSVDKVKLDQYKNVSSKETKTVIENILGEIYTRYIEYQKILVYKQIKKTKPDNLWSMTNIVNKYVNSYKFTENIDLSSLNSDILDTYYLQLTQNIKTKEYPIEKQELLKIPISSKIKQKDITIKLNYKIKDIDITFEQNRPICYHYIKWISLKQISRKKDEELNQAIFDFVKQYVKVNERNEYICKSCSEVLDLKKYVYEGTYVPELDTFQTTNLSVNQNIEEMPKYAKYTKTIRNIEKNIEKIANAVNLSYYIGNTPVIKLRRKLIIKDTIDLILVHGEYLKNQPKDRKQKAVEISNIHPDLTNLFFFELKDEVFLTSSLDTDQYKHIKFNNVLAYILVVLITDLNVGMIISMKDDKKCNFFLYSNIGEKIFSTLYIRLNEKEKISINKIPLLAYVLFYMSCILTNNNIWLWNNTQKGLEYNIQKIIIHTMVDLINTLIEANMLTKKSYIYELIVNRLMYKIQNTYIDKNALDLINTEMKNKIKIDSTTNKISYIVKKKNVVNIQIDNLHLEGNNKPFIPLVVNDPLCTATTYNLNIKQTILFNNNVDIYTNCSDGNFHNWAIINKTITCNLCNLSYDDIKINGNNDTVTNISRITQLKMLYLKKIATNYCINGELHDIDATTNICNKCKINVNEFKYTNQELLKLEKNFTHKNDNNIMLKLNDIKKQFTFEANEREMELKYIAKQNELYIKYTDNKLLNYIDNFIDILIKNLGNTIKIDNNRINLRDTMYIIKHNYMGNDIKEPIVILSSHNKIHIIEKHPHFKINVIYYHDEINNAYVYYDQLTKNYLGYSKESNPSKMGKYIMYSKVAFIKIVHSIKDMILYLGLENKFYNIYHISTLYMNKPLDMNKSLDTNKDNTVNIPEIYTQIIRTRCNNLKQCIYRTTSIIEKIKNSFINKKNIHNILEFNLVSEFQTLLKDFKITDKNNENEIFKKVYIITNNINIDKIEINDEPLLLRNYIDTDKLIGLNNMDSKLLFYYLYNLNKLIDYNDLPAIRTNICYMIIKLIIYNYNMYNIPIENIYARKFDTMLLTDAPYLDESSRVMGYYNDLVNVKDIDEAVQNELDYDINEEMNSIDLDNNDIEDDILDYDAMDEILEHSTDS